MAGPAGQVAVSEALSFLLVLTMLSQGSPDVQVRGVGVTSEGVMGETGCLDLGRSTAAAVQRLGGSGALVAFSCLPIRSADVSSSLVVALRNTEGTVSSEIFAVPTSVCDTAAERLASDLRELAGLARSQVRFGGVVAGGGASLTATCLALPRAATSPSTVPATAAPPPAPTPDHQEAELETSGGERCRAPVRDLSPARWAGWFTIATETAGSCPAGAVVRRADR